MNEPRFTATLLLGTCESRIVANNPAELDELIKVIKRHYRTRGLNFWRGDQCYPGPKQGEARC